MSKKIYAIERIGVGDEDPYAISFDADKLIEWFDKEGDKEADAYIVAGTEMSDGVYHVSYGGTVIAEWDAEKKKWHYVGDEE